MAAESVRVTRNIVSMPALAKYRPEEFRPGLEFQNDEELAKAAGDISTTIFHPVGTCKMGSDEAPWSIPASRCAASPACASPTPPSCPPSRQATPTRPP